MDRTEYISFSSAGTRGVAYVGMLDCLEDHIQKKTHIPYDEWRRNIKGVAGCSAGCIAALMFALGIPRSQRHESVREMGDMRSVLRSPDIGLLLQRFGLEDGRSFKDMVQRIIMRGGLSAVSTLADFRRLLRVDFVCVCTNLHNGTPMHLSASSHPDVLVCDAVYASCCIPFLFLPHQISGQTVVDGCLSCAMPEVFDEAKTLFVFVQGARGGEMTNWAEFLHGIVLCSTIAQAHRIDRLCHLFGDRCLQITLPDTLSTLSFDIHMSHADVQTMINFGYTSTLNTLCDTRLQEALETAISQYIRIAHIEATSDERPPDDEFAPSGHPSSGSQSTETPEQ